MIPPFIHYVTFNRLGLTIRNLQSVLETTDDFEMHIVDSNSQDNTWEFIQDLNDPRIKSKTRLPLNCGPILPANMNLTKRNPDQYFITLDSDVNIKTKDWISRFIKVFNTFPEVGLLGLAKGEPYEEFYPPVTPKKKNGVWYLQLRDGFIDSPLDFVPGCCQCVRPELFNEIGYWSEENGYGDAEICARINNYTAYKSGFVMDIDIDMVQTISCDECQGKKWCKLDQVETTCFVIRDRLHKNEGAAEVFKSKFDETFKELQEGTRTAYCASIIDPESMQKHLYHKDWALENFSFFIQNAN